MVLGDVEESAAGVFALLSHSHTYTRRTVPGMLSVLIGELRSVRRRRPEKGSGRGESRVSGLECRR